MSPSPPVQALLDVLAAPDRGVPDLDAAGWDAFAAEAARHGVSALVHHQLTLARTDVPPVAAQAVLALENHRLRNRLRNLRLHARVASLLRALAGEGVEVIVLKGVYLAQAVYADPALRAMADADLLVRDADLQRTAAMMRALGWRQSGQFSEGGHQLPTFELEGVQVEVHWTIEDDAAPFKPDMAGLWQRAVPTQIGHARAWALSPEDLLLHLCLHTAYGHGWLQFDGGLRQLCDIAAVVRHHGDALDWHVVSARAKAWRVERCVWLALATAQRLLDARVPAAAMEDLGSAPVNAPWLDTACDLALNFHYAQLGRKLPALAPNWLHKRWRQLTPATRRRAHLLPDPAALWHAHPALRGHVKLAHLVHWYDLIRDALRLALSRNGQALGAMERRRRALVAWLESAA
jgi:hypothetical protein